MNLFRSEEHVRNWSGFKAGTEAGINKLSDIAGLFSMDFFTRRSESDYASRMHDYLQEFVGALKNMGSFWHPPEQK
ncbi:MAG TPA: hypothetical protein ACFCUC_09230 [Desulfobacterales bacterium]